MIKRLFLPLLLLLICAPLFAASDDVAAKLATEGLFLTLLSVFLSGILVSATPCVYPMIPITLSIIGARSAEQKPITGFLRSLVFVLGIATIYTALGLVAAHFKITNAFLLQHTWFFVVLSVLFAAMGLSMMGFYEIQVPAKFAGKLQQGANRGGFVGAFLLGLVTGVVASPCGSPVLVSILVLAAGKGFLGGMMLFTYALGIGMLFLVLGTFPVFLKAMPKSGVWMEDVKLLLGALLFGMAVYYLQYVFGPTPFWMLVVAVSLIGALIIAVKSGKRKKTPLLFNAWRLSAAALAVFAVYVAVMHVPSAIAASSASRLNPLKLVASAKEMIKDEKNFTAISTANRTVAPGTNPVVDLPTPAAAKTPAPSAGGGDDEWGTNEEAALAEAKNDGKPVIIDFGAAWCAACKELERDTFPAPQVKPILANFVKLRIDCTKQSDANDALLKKYNKEALPSLPTVAFIDKNGKFDPSLNLYTFEKPEKFVERLKKVKQ